MKMTKWKHVGVKKDGVVFESGGAVNTKGAIRMSNGEGCGSKGCHCSDGHWIMICMPRTAKGVVDGVTVKFDNNIEMNTFLKYHNIEG